MDEKKISYTAHAFDFNAKEPEKAFGYVEGFCKSVEIREVQTQNGPVKVATVKVSAVIPDKKTERMFGADFVNEQYHSVLFRISYWGLAAESLEKYPPQVNQKVLCLMKNMKTDSRKGNNGTVYHTVNATGIDYLRTNSAKKEDGTYALISAMTAASSESEERGNEQEPEFIELDSMCDEELPF